MADKVLRKHDLVRELAELRWRINKLEEMKKVRSGNEQLSGTEEELRSQNQSTQFFLGLGLSRMVKTEDEHTIETNNHRGRDYRHSKGGI
jgi:hypothetical protein